MKKILSIKLAVIITFCIMSPAVTVTAEEDDDQTPKTRRTILFYLCGTDLETSEGAANLQFASDPESEFQR